MEEKLLNEWQERLGLQDWAIVLKYNCKFSDMELDNVEGETEWSTSIKDAVIRILDPNEYGHRIQNFDFEKVLVHELLHLKFAVLDCEKGSYESKVMEVVRHQLIDDLARALIMAKRGEIKRKLAKDVKKVQDINEKDDKCNNCDTRNLLIDKIVEESKKQCEAIEKINEVI